ncbi:MAG: zf-HC2 domain-containing protein [Pyrinomonadaceae bacterium]
MIKTISCTRAEKFIPLHVAGDLRGRRARAVTHHLAICENCRHTAAAYHAGRNLWHAASTPPPEFDDAFYDEIRNSVLAQIKRNRTLAPPFSASFFQWRPAYTASLALLIIAVMLSLHSHLRRTMSDARQQSPLLALNVNRELTATPAKTPTIKLNQTDESNRQIIRSQDETAARTTRQRYGPIAPTQFDIRHLGSKNAPGATQRSLTRKKWQPASTPSEPTFIAAAANATRQIVTPEITPNSGQIPASLEVSRIEMQTSDPNIRIIWLSPTAAADEIQRLK